jgi:hypothetical protein
MTWYRVVPRTSPKSVPRCTVPRPMAQNTRMSRRPTSPANAPPNARPRVIYHVGPEPGDRAAITEALAAALVSATARRARQAAEAERGQEAEEGEPSK